MTGSVVCEAITPAPPIPCDSSLRPLEPMPAQPAGSILSGYTKHWAFTVPTRYDNSGQVPPGTDVYMLFNQVQSLTRLMRRANGQPLTQVKITLPSS